jgi:CheY-like chemotaxis protein
VFSGAAILICEDEPFIALELALSVEDAGGTVVGPAASVREALDLLEDHKIDGAILDVNLIGGEVTPILVCLMLRGVPVVVQTGVGLPPALESLETPPPVFLKPVSPDRLLRRLAEEMHRIQSG